MNTIKFAFLLLLPFAFSSNRALESAQSLDFPGWVQSQETGSEGAANIAFKSVDGGETCQDISKGLPENLLEEDAGGNGFFANDNGLFFRFGNGLYHSAPNATAPFWTKEISTAENSSSATGASAIPANNYWGINLKTRNGTSIWSPIFENFHEQRIRTTFETAGGTIFAGTDRGIFKTDNTGKTWNLVYAGGLVGHLAELDGVLVCTSMRKIIRSTDNGETWAPAISEDNVCWDIKPVKGGFVAITAVSESGTRRLSTSVDGGKTWQSIHSALRDKVVIDSIWRTWDDRPRLQAFQTSITQVGENFFCMHPDGIFRSSDKGKKWKLLLASIADKGFGLFVSGNVMYAVRSKGGC